MSAARGPLVWRSDGPESYRTVLACCTATREKAQALLRHALADLLAADGAGDPLLRGYWLPTIEALLDINTGDPGRALSALRATTAFELGIPEPTVEEAAPFLPPYVRGRAYLLLHQGKEAAAEFEKLLTYRALTTNSPRAALIPLQLGRAHALQGDAATARSRYRDFLDAWHDADAGIPVLISARTEFATFDARGASRPATLH